MLDVLTAHQIAEWEAYHRLEPIGEERQEFSIAVLTSVLTNIAIAAFGKRGAKQTSPMDFMPKWDSEERNKEQKPKQQSVEEMKQILQAIAAAGAGAGTGKKKKGR